MTRQQQGWQDSADFRTAAECVLRYEGPESHDPRDRGGYTKFGISERAFPHVDVRHLTKEGALDLYWTHFWVPICGKELPWPLNFALFDGAVQHGVGTAVRLFQEAVGTKPDGIMGPLTVGAAQRGPSREIFQDFLTRRAAYYVRLARAADNTVFLKGWLRRLILVAIDGTDSDA